MPPIRHRLACCMVQCRSDELPFGWNEKTSVSLCNSTEHTLSSRGGAVMVRMPSSTRTQYDVTLERDRP